MSTSSLPFFLFFLSYIIVCFVFTFSRLITKSLKNIKSFKNQKHALSFLACAFYFLHLEKRPKTNKKNQYMQKTKNMHSYSLHEHFTSCNLENAKTTKKKEKKNQNMQKLQKLVFSFFRFLILCFPKTKKP